MECLDLLVNTGYAIDAETYELDPGSKPFYTSRFGIDFRLRDWGSTTSWMAPLGLAHLAHLQKNAYESGAGRLTAQELLQLATGGEPETNKMVDPLRNSQFNRILK